MTITRSHCCSPKCAHDRQRPRPRYRSIVIWPDEVSTGKVPNESTDIHSTLEQAEAVCRAIKRDGLGGEGNVFPLSTRVEIVKPGESQ